MSDNNKVVPSSAPAPPTLSNTIGFINAFKSLLKKNHKNDKTNNALNNKGNNKIIDTSNSGNNEGVAVGLSVLPSTRERRSSSEAPPPLAQNPSNRIERSHSDVPLPSITTVSSPSPSTNPALAYMALSPSSRARTFKTYKFRPLPPIPSLDCPEVTKDTLQKIDNIHVSNNNNDNINKENLINDNTLKITPTRATPLSANLSEPASPFRLPSPAVDFEDDFGIITCPPTSPPPSSPTNNPHLRKLSIITETLPPPSHNARQNTPHHLNKIEIPSQMFANFYSIEERNHRLSSEDVGRSKEGLEKMERKADGEVGDGEIDDFILIDDYNENGKNADVI